MDTHARSDGVSVAQMETPWHANLRDLLTVVN